MSEELYKHLIESDSGTRKNLLLRVIAALPAEKMSSILREAEKDGLIKRHKSARLLQLSSDLLNNHRP